MKASRIDLADSALHAPAASFGGEEFYPELFDKAAVLCWRAAGTTRSLTATSGPHGQHRSCSSTSTGARGARGTPDVDDAEEAMLGDSLREKR